jgi:hypothetical protein
MAKNRTYLYIALGVLLLAIIISAFYFRTSSVKEGLSSWSKYANKDIKGNNLISLPVKIKIDKLTKQRDAYLDVSDRKGITKRFLRDNKLRTSHFRGKTCQHLCENLKKCKSYVVDYTDKSCTLKNTKASPFAIDKSLVIKKKFRLTDSANVAADASKNVKVPGFISSAANKIGSTGTALAKKLGIYSKAKKMFKKK